MKRTPLKRGTRMTRKVMVRHAPRHGYRDGVWRRKVKERDKYTCQSCLRGVRGKGGYSLEPGQLEAAHIHRRGYLATRWDVKNGLSMCWLCHGYFTAHPSEWKVFCIGKIGEAEYERLHQKAEALG